MNRLKIPSIILLFCLVIILIIISKHIYNYDIGATHLLYIPVILTAFLWQYRVIYAIVITGIILITADILTGRSVYIVPDLIELGLVMFAGILTAAMRMYIISLASYRKYNDILSAVQEPMAIIDSTFSIIIQNEMFSLRFGGGLHESIISIPGGILNDEGLKDALITCFGGSESVYQGKFMTISGQAGLFEIKCCPLVEEGLKPHAILNFRDITRESRASYRQKATLDRQRIAIDILELLNSKTPKPEMIHEILKLVSQTTGIGATGLRLAEENGFNLYSSAGITVLTNYLRSDCADFDPEDSESFCIRSIMPEEPCVIADLGTGYNNFFHVNDLDEYNLSEKKKTCRCMISAGLKSFALIPVHSNYEISGCFILIDRRKSFFTEELLDFFQAIVQTISIALDRLKYEENLKHIINEKELLLREVHHRVKNNMQVVTSLISLQASRQTDDYVKSILTECQNRVRTMALVHEKLYSSNNFTSINFGHYINTLVPLLMNSYRIEKNQITVDVSAQDIQLGLNTAIPLAQLVNEILSNVFKHAFPGGKTGSVLIVLSGDKSTGINVLEIKDTGTGLTENVSYPDGGNLGFQLIEALVKQIGGKIKFSGEGGVSIKITFRSL